jgi:two-component sensor histidine kinase
MMQDFEGQFPSIGGGMAEADPETLRASLIQTRALLREVDHRVKNNLQLIASLIQLQNRRTEDAAARHALQTVLERLNAVTTVHRRLFQGDPQQFEVAEFIRDLTPDLAAAAGRDDISIALDLEAVQVPASAAAPLALVVNELLGNALKHAYPAGQGGQVRVTLRGEGPDCILSIADDGAGLAGRPAGLGLTIVRLLCQQLRAQLTLDETTPGLTVVLRAPRGEARPAVAS